MAGGIDEWKRNCDEAEVISFDIFDTLILRNVYKPTDIFEAVGKKTKELSWCDDFAKLRIQAEADSRKKVQNGECNLEEIYQEIRTVIPDYANEIQRMELETEMQFITVNPFMKEIYNYCQKMQKRIIFISDMYLSSEFIRRLLRKCGYSEEKIFVSNEYRKNKGNGALYEEARKECGLDKNKWIHIGDNRKSDYEQAINYGIRALLYKNVSTYFEWDVPLNLAESIMVGVQNNLLFNGTCSDYWERFGIACAFPIYMGFAKWLFNMTCGEDNLFFLARDGYVVKQLYENICRITGKKIYTDYLHVSRNTLSIPVMALDPQMDRAIKLMTNPDGFRDGAPTVRDILRTIRIYDSDISIQMLQLFDLESMEDIVNQENCWKVQKLAAWLSDKVRERLLKEKDLLMEYLDEREMFQWDKINIMDIGWVGSCQDALEKILGKSVRGYYFGTLDTSSRDKYCSMFGWVFDDGVPSSDAGSIYRNGMMYEWLFSAPHGSVCRYERKKEGIVPVLSLCSGYSGIVERFQKAALNAADRCIEYLEYIDHLRPQVCLMPYREMMSQKRKEDIDHFKNLFVDSAPGCDLRYPYIVRLEKEDVINREWDKLLRLLDRSFWEGAWYMDDTGLSENDRWLMNYVLASGAYRPDNVHKYYSYNLEVAKIYYDFGEGFNEKDSILVPMKRDGIRYSIDLDVNLEVKQVRIDPIEGRRIKIKNYAVWINGEKVHVKVPGLAVGIPGCLKEIRTTDPLFAVRITAGHVSNIRFESDIILEP